MLTTAGTVVEASTPDVAGLAAGSILYQVFPSDYSTYTCHKINDHQLAHTTIQLLIEVIISDFTSLRSRAFYLCIPSSPFIVSLITFCSAFPNVSRSTRGSVEMWLKQFLVRLPGDGDSECGLSYTQVSLDFQLRLERSSNSSSLCSSSAHKPLGPRTPCQTSWSARILRNTSRKAKLLEVRD